MRYGIGIIIIALLAITAILVLARPSKQKPPRTGSTQAETVLATNYENDDNASLVWERQGPVVGEDQRRAIRVTITRNRRTIEIVDGYNNTIATQHQFDSNPAAFSTFVRALDYAGFGKLRGGKPADERGACPLLTTTVYKLMDGGKQVLRSWSDTCANSDGSFGGQPTTVLRLFRNQITDFDKITTGITF